MIIDNILNAPIGRLYFSIYMMQQLVFKMASMIGLDRVLKIVPLKNFVY